MTTISIKISDAEADVVAALVQRRGFANVGAWLEHQLAHLKTMEAQRTAFSQTREINTQAFRGKARMEKE